MRNLFLAAALAVFISPLAGASDVGEDVRSQGKVWNLDPFAVPSAEGANDLWETLPSDFLREPFDTVLLQGACPGGKVQFEASRNIPQGNWSSWQPPQRQQWLEPGGRFWVRFSFKGSSAGYLRLRRQKLGAGCSLDLRSVQVFSSELDGAEQAPSGLGEAPELPDFPPELHVVTRADWGAQPARNSPVYQHPQLMTQHHTAGICPSDLEQAKAEMRFLQNFHQNGRGWDDIGYHLVIDCGGHIFQGRPLNVQGAHVQGHNADNVGISIMGYYHPPYNDEIKPEQRTALVALGSWLIRQYGIHPEEYKAHRDYNSGTACPGDNIYRMIPEIRNSFGTLPAALNRNLWKLADPLTFAQEQLLQLPFQK